MVEKWEDELTHAGEKGGGDLPNSYTMFAGNFPDGLRVLLFDEDQEYLHVLKKHLQEFQYQVTTCKEEDRAIDLLCNHRNMFDIAIVEAKNLEGELFQLISEIGSAGMDLPIIITSKDYSRESVTKWMRNGACDYLIKPIRPEDLRLIYKYLVKKMELRNVKIAQEAEEKSPPEKSSSVDSTIRNPNKRKLQTGGEDRDHNRDPATKKRRVVWDDYLNSKFLEAMNYLGTREAVPKKILERMNVSSLTRENVASHLQKFRLSQKKQDDQNKKDERNRSLITPRGVSSGERNVQQQNTNLNLLAQRMTTHQHHIPHRVPEFTCKGQDIEERLVYNEEDELVVNNFWFPQNPEQMNMSHVEEPLIETFNNIHLSPNPQQLMYVLEPSMMHIPSLTSHVTHDTFLDQKETITMVEVRGQQLFFPEQQEANLTYDNRLIETNPRSGSARRDKMGQDQGQA